MMLATGWAATLGASYATRRKRNEYIEHHRYLRSVWDALEKDTGTRNRAMATAVLGTLSTIGTAATFPVETMNALASAKDLVVNNWQSVGEVALGAGIMGVTYKGVRALQGKRAKRDEEFKKAFRTLPRVPYSENDDCEMQKLRAELNDSNVPRVDVMKAYGEFLLKISQPSSQADTETLNKNPKTRLNEYYEATLGFSQAAGQLAALSSEKKIFKQFKAISRENIEAVHDGWFAGPGKTANNEHLSDWSQRLKDIHTKYG
jgi:hypothetical protein